MCKGKLVLHEPGEQSSDSANLQLVCRFDRLAYAVDDGIPVLLDSESIALSLEELEKVKKHD